MPGLLPAHAKENDDGQGKPPSLPNYHRPRMNQPPGQELPRDEFGTGLIEKLVSRGALRHPCLRNFSTIGGELAHDLLVEPNIHFR
jgi:hypothetical protein